MRMLVLALSCLVLAPLAAAADAYSGRWKGSVDIPGNEVGLILDLDRDASGAPIGSATMPELNLRGAALSDIVIKERDASFNLAHALAGPDQSKAGFKARIGSDGRMSGEFSQAGHSAHFALARIGPAQVELPPHSTPVPAALEGAWSGDFVGVGGYPRHVTITLSNHGAAGASAEFVVVGKQTTTLPVDLVTLAEGVLRVESGATAINFEGRYAEDRGELSGSFDLRGTEFPLVLKRKP